MKSVLIRVIRGLFFSFFVPIYRDAMNSSR
jgi:hypothetical protein